MRSSIDLLRPGLAAELHAAFGSLREHAPVHRLDDATWLVSRYDDVAALLKDRTRCGTDIHRKRGYDELRPFGAGTALETFQEGLLVNLGDSDHRRVRGAFTPRFTRAAVEQRMTSIVERHAAALLDALPDDGPADWVAELSGPLPARVFADLFNLPRRDLPQLVEWLHQDTVAFDALLDPQLLVGDALAVGQDAMLNLREYLHQLATERLTSRGDDLLSFLLDGHEQGALSWDDVLTQAMETLAAGTSTTNTLIAGMLEAFAAFPDQWVRVTDPRSAVEEALRFVSPALAMARVAELDFELHGERIEAGQVIQCAVLPANRDPRQFPDPDRFDVTRTPNRHVAFGGGVHTCLGAHVARLEARVVLERARTRWRSIEVDHAAVELNAPLMIRTYKTLPVWLLTR